MAKPIETTPPLKGEDAKRFIEALVEANKKITPQKVEEIRKKAFSIKFKVTD